VQVARLPDTPENFPIKDKDLIKIAKEVFDKGVGLENPESLVS
jgi:hypothetical protein